MQKYYNKTGMRQKYNEYSRKYAKEHYDYRKLFPSKIKQYGLSIEDYAWLLYKQNFRCAICPRTENLHLDHCHKTGKVRGFLCRLHNLLLGKLEVFETDFIKLKDYLNV